MDTPVPLRREATASDEEAVAGIAASTGFFHPDEIEVARELVRERLAKGPASGYFFLFADGPDGPMAYACFGPIACTRESFALYWIAVHRDRQGQGLGKLLMKAVKNEIRQMGGTRVYAETSARPQYAPTRAFYEHSGFTLDSLQHDFYAPADHKATYLLILK